MKRRMTTIMALVLALSLSLALPAMAESESGYKSCASNSHVYTKAKWQTSYSAWLDITADGVREKTDSDTNGGVWEIDYMNLWGWGTVHTWINGAYYYIYGTSLSTTLSWPGCEAD